MQRSHLSVPSPILFFLALILTALIPLSAPAQSDDAFLDDLQERAFNYFWTEANPDNGLVKDRSASWSPGKMAATGFGLSAICIGIDHGWVTREAGRQRVLTTMRTLWSGPQGPEPAGNIGYKGFFYHFVDLQTAVRTWDCDLAPIDTALLFAGIIDSRQYFSGADSLDIEVRELADAIVQRADWTFMYNGLGIALTWWPESGLSPITWLGYNEAMLMYLLAIGSATHPIPPSAWYTWTSNYRWETHYGYEFVTFPPLFGHQYTHCWIDFRDIQDVYMRSQNSTYFENSRRATLAARAYCIDNPSSWVGYGENVWGLTASDDPQFGYIAHGAPPAQHDNGTITPTAAAGSLPFAPQEVLAALREMRQTYGAQIWGTYGFKDAFNPTLGWTATDYLGIDQGPIVLMIENYRTGAVWDRVMAYPDIQRGLSLAGFATATAAPPEVAPEPLLRAFPNPFNAATAIRYRLAQPDGVVLRIHDAAGRLVKRLVAGQIQAAGEHEIVWHGRDERERPVAAGVYFCRLRVGPSTVTERIALVP